MNTTRHQTMLSEHFSLEEMSYSRIAVDNGLNNEPPFAARKALKYLADNLLEPLRQLHKGPIAILSGYRSRSVNSLAGGVATSQHQKGEAADCYVPKGPAYLLGLLKKSGLIFDQAIIYRQRNFLHLSLKEVGCNRMQILYYLFCFVFLLPACRIQREGTDKETVIHADSLLVTGKDSFLFNRRISVMDSIDWNMTRLVMLPPDSTGRQYPAEITLLQGNKHSVLADTIENKRDSSRKVIRGESRLSSSSSQKVYKQSFPVWGWMTGGMVVCVLIIFYRAKNR